MGGQLLVMDMLSRLRPNKHIANGGYISHNSKQQPFTVAKSM